MNLRQLDLSNNEIEKIENLGSLKQLRVLQLNANRIRKIENISVLKNLEILELSQNLIDEIPSLISLNKYLVTIDISNNLIQKREHLLNLRPCTKLRFLFITGNPLTGYGDYLYYITNHLRQLVSIDGQMIPNANFSQKIYVHQLAAESKAFHTKQPSETNRNEQNFLENDQEEFGEEDGYITAKSQQHYVSQAGYDTSPLRDTVRVKERRKVINRSLSKKSPMIKNRQMLNSNSSDRNKSSSTNQEPLQKLHKETNRTTVAEPQQNMYRPGMGVRHNSFNENSLFAISDSNVDLNHEGTDRQSTNRTRRPFVPSQLDSILKSEYQSINTRRFEEAEQQYPIQVQEKYSETKRQANNNCFAIGKEHEVALYSGRGDFEAEQLNVSENKEDSNQTEGN